MSGDEYEGEDRPIPTVYTRDSPTARTYSPATSREILAQPCVVEALKKRDEVVRAIYTNLLYIKDALDTHPGNFMQVAGGPENDYRVRHACLEARNAVEYLAKNYPLKPG